MNEVPIQPIRTEAMPSVVIVGLRDRFTPADAQAIGRLWEQVTPHVQGISFGVIHNSSDDGAFDYLAGIQDRDGLPEGWTSMSLEAQTYAVFWHAGHESRHGETCGAIFGQWLPNSAYRGVEAPFLERYGPEFNGETLEGLEIWVPIQAK